MWYNVTIMTKYGDKFKMHLHERKLDWLRKMTFTFGAYANYSAEAIQ